MNLHDLVLLLLAPVPAALLMGIWSMTGAPWGTGDDTLRTASLLLADPWTLEEGATDPLPGEIAPLRSDANGFAIKDAS